LAYRRRAKAIDPQYLPTLGASAVARLRLPCRQQMVRPLSMRREPPPVNDASSEIRSAVGQQFL
jgi:hypothetical protein